MQTFVQGAAVGNAAGRSADTVDVADTVVVVADTVAAAADDIAASLGSPAVGGEQPVAAGTAVADRNNCVVASLPWGFAGRYGLDSAVSPSAGHTVPWSESVHQSEPESGPGREPQHSQRKTLVVECPPYVAVVPVGGVYQAEAAFVVVVVVVVVVAVVAA